MTDQSILAVTSVREWRALPEIVFPVIEDEGGRGSAYSVQKVGFLWAEPKDCRKINIRHAVLAEARFLLPTAVVDDGGGKRTLCRLPVDIGYWVLNMVKMAHEGKNLLPARVEFGVLRDRHYAEIL